MNNKYVVLFLSIFLTSQIFCQTETCLQNLNHPKYNSISQNTSTETIVREYILHVPTDYNNENASPLVINMHGFGDCAVDFHDLIGNFYEFNKLADEESFLVAYPQGAYRPQKEDTYWEPGDNGSSNIYENDVYFIEQLIIDISEEYNINQEKIYALGYSNGGMMAYSLACNRSNLFAGVGIMSGTMLEEDCNVDNSIPIIKFHGIEDEVLPYEGNLWYQSVSEVVNFWLDQNNIPQNSLTTTELNDGNVVLNAYKGSNDSSCFHLYTINEEYDKPGGHVWFSDEINGSSPNEIIWNFFSNNCNSSTSTSENPHLDKDLNIYPNPFQDLLRIEKKKTAQIHFEIYNTLGELKLTGKLDANLTTINLNYLPPNIYFLKAGNQIKKLIKTQ